MLSSLQLVSLSLASACSHRSLRLRILEEQAFQAKHCPDMKQLDSKICQAFPDLQVYLPPRVVNVGSIFIEQSADVESTEQEG